MSYGFLTMHQLPSYHCQQMHAIDSLNNYFMDTLTSGGSCSLELSSDPSQGADEHDAMRHRLTTLSLPPLVKNTFVNKQK